MDFLIQNAWAQGAGAQEPSLVGFLPLIILFVVFYLFLIRPQMKRQKDHSKMVQALAKGDEAVTNGGLLGRITEVGNNFVKLEVAKDQALFRVIDPALVSESPSKPKKRLIITLSAVVALFFCIFLAFFIEFVGNLRKRAD